MSEIEPRDFEEVCRSFARWILQQKRLRRPNILFLVGVNGTIGQGKTVFSLAVAKQLNELLKPEEGQAVTRSLDDYYLSKAERYQPEFLARGYNPNGIPNRGPAGTHDTAKLWQDIQAMEAMANPSPPPSPARGEGKRKKSTLAPSGGEGVRVRGQFLNFHLSISKPMTAPPSLIA